MLSIQRAINESLASQASQSGDDSFSLQLSRDDTPPVVSSRSGPSNTLPQNSGIVSRKRNKFFSHDPTCSQNLTHGFLGPLDIVGSLVPPGFKFERLSKFSLKSPIFDPFDSAKSARTPFCPPYIKTGI